MNLANRDHPVFEPEKWNKDKNIKKAHNCYSYALNLIHKDQGELCGKYMNKTKKNFCSMLKPQPGRYAGYVDEYKKKRIYTCKKVHKRMKKDNPLIRKLRPNQKCPDGYYKMALTIREDLLDYHYYRQDKSGLWSHKMGSNAVTNKDASGKVIRDPQFADRGRYTIFCGYYMVPNKKSLKRMSNKTRRKNNHISRAEKVANMFDNSKTRKIRKTSKKV